ncbi:Glucose-fructose oxidoreductase [Candidatus Rhodobacter oscarellae]|uniref:Glucose-fructose oxidoreductase n=1 Tax=Candidatus Rhodobacter oscarellae TaxID=1675527 RepID=A0A0J9E2A5_9RHOB|nr:Gfo/Idh/MocA family oxidoreductase [Candidatus Rhodobacter lobularis]KMW56822.1 Glucose-fructose oxidoreductase [Candidatus Rhodobacter lobularis]
MKRIAVAGLGLIGARHARAVLEHPGAELAAVVEPDPALRAQWDVPGYASLAEVDGAVDGAILATPSHLHADHAEICLDRGWPCLIEKPIEVSLAAADRIVAASAWAGLPVLTGHHRRYHASAQALREIVRGGEIGQPVLANVIWAVKKPDEYFQGNWRAGGAGSPVMINTVHDIDFLRFILGEIAVVSAQGSRPVRAAPRVESGVVTLRFESGAMASIAFADTCPSPWGFEAGTYENPNIAGSGQDCMWIMGTKGGVSFPSLTVWTGAAHWGEAPHQRRAPAADTVPLEAQLAHFLDVLDGAAPLITAQDARQTLAATLEVERQVAQGAAQARAS